MSDLQQVHGRGSWIIVCRATGKPVLETWNHSVAAAINIEKYEVLTALEWLQRHNRLIQA